MPELETMEQLELTEKLNPFGEKYFKEVNENTFIKDDSKTTYAKFTEGVFDKEDTLYFICGSDSGLFIKYIETLFNEEPKGRKFIFIDYQPVVNKLNLEELPDWIEVLGADVTLEQLANDEIEYYAMHATTLVKSMASLDAKIGSLYFDLMNQMEKEYEQTLLIDMMTTETKPFIDAQLDNISFNQVSIGSLKNQFTGKTAVIIGGGPSLDETVDWIKENQDYIIIFAAARVSNRLIKEQITPDFIVSVDPHNLSYDNSKKMYPFEKESILLNCYHVNPKLLSQWEGESVYFGEKYPWLEMDGEKNSLSFGPTVMHSTVYQAFFLGFKSILLSGVDLCFYRGQTHESNSSEAKVGQFVVKNSVFVETYSGAEAETDSIFFTGVQSLANIVTRIQSLDSEVKFYNLSQNAAKIAGIDYKSSDQITFQKEADKSTLMKEVKYSISRDAKLLEQQLSTDLKTLHQHVQYVKQLLKITDKGIKLSKVILKDASKEPELISQKEKLDKKLGEFGVMLFHYGHQFFKGVFKPSESKKILTQEEVSSILESYFNGMNQSLNDYLKKVRKSIERVVKRQQEVTSPEKFEEVFNSWDEREEYGRYKGWLKFNSREKLTEPQKQLLNIAIEKFSLNIEDSNTGYEKRLQNWAHNIIDIYNAATVAFLNNNIEQIDLLLVQAEGSEASEKGQVILLIKGMKQEAQKNLDTAIEYYEKVSFGPIKVFAWKRLLQIYIAQKAHEKVVYTLEKLCVVSIEYVVIYADYMAMHDQYGAALELLRLYLKQKPEDIPVYTKSIDYSLKVHDIKSAKYFLEVLISKDATNHKIGFYQKLLVSSSLD
ncbi:MAG: hypothetical protein ISEC1_P0086 [Thiomicrorhabdus sp.]|nr:MAG: hypothetical protein ISEC1_P0086 [Thiomicrorhabdus sp.]